MSCNQDVLANQSPAFVQMTNLSTVIIKCNASQYRIGQYCYHVLANQSSAFVQMTVLLSCISQSELCICPDDRPFYCDNKVQCIAVQDRSVIVIIVVNYYIHN